ncbi:MAG TPA: hypothetical protein VHV10_16490 [Ktedonobacteraceae bacterium]|jgi:hypothetical protein|nr:hypothetical protein [Ktedonobacteraceae bacterium]
MPVTGKTILDAADIPQNSVIVPGNPAPVLMRGSTNVSTDNNDNTTTPVSFNLEQIGEIIFTLGQKIKDLSISVAIATDQIVSIQQSDLSATGVINAAQPLIGTPVAGASVTLVLGQGQSSWKAQLLAGGGGFTSATTIVVDGSPDGGTTWYSKSFKVAGVTPNNPQSSIVGPGPLELTGNAASLTHIKVRCSVLNSTETINARIDASAAIGDVGLMGSLPAGQNLVGYVEDIEQQGYIALTSPPATTNVGTVTTLTFSQQVNRVEITNGGPATINYSFDSDPCTAGSFYLVPGAYLNKPKKVTTVNILTATAQNINGSTAGNIGVKGSL